MIRQGDWIRHRKVRGVRHVIKVHRDGLLEVEWRGWRGEIKRRVITRPEEYRVVEKEEVT